MFKRRLGKKNLIGLDIGSSAIKAVGLRGRLGSLQLASISYETLQTDSIADGQIMELNDVSNCIANIFTSQQIKTDQVVAGVSGNSVIVKNIIVPQMSEAELEESIDWHAEEHIPFDIADVSLDYQIVDSNPDSLHVLMAACKRDRIANLKQAIQLAGKQPVIIDIDAFALQNCYEANYDADPDETVALLNIGASTMNINILHGTRSMSIRDVSFGGKQYTTHLQKELGLTFEQAERLKRGEAPGEGTEPPPIEPMLEGVSEILALEIQKTFDFYRTTAAAPSATVQKILISGGGSKLRGLHEFLADHFQTTVEPLNPFQRIEVDAKRVDPDYLRETVPEMAVAVGLALRGVEG